MNVEVTSAKATAPPSPAATRPPKIAYMLGSFPELTQSFVLREIGGLQELGFAVEIFAIKRAQTLKPDQAFDANLLRQCVFARPDSTLRLLVSNLVQAIRHPKRYLSTIKIFAPLVYRLAPATSMRALYHMFCGIGFSRIMRRSRINHMHAHFTTGANMALAASHFSGIPFSWTAHASGDLFVHPVLLKDKVMRAEFVAAVCEYSRRYLDSLTARRYSHKLYRIYNGLDSGEPERLFTRWKGKRASELITVVSVGNLLSIKGHAILIEACDLLKKRGLRLRCDIIGEGPEREVLEEMISRASLGDVIHLLGRQPLGQVYAALARADIFVLLSEIGESGYRDGFPTVILEAMLMGLPVVSTLLSGIPEIVEHGVTGYLVPERDPSAAADVIAALALDEDKRRQFGNAGRKRVMSRFTLRESVQRKAELIVRSLPRCVEAWKVAA